MAINCLISAPAPDFKLLAIKPGTPIVETLSLSDFAGHWVLLIFYPRDFSFVCPTELISFSIRSHDFQQRNCRLLAMSVDAIESHMRWVETSQADGGVGSLDFPLASDADGSVARKYGVWSEAEKISHRGTFIIDAEGIIQYGVAHNLAVGRSVDETLRVLDALQTGGLCPASWTRADGNLDLENALKPGRVLGQYRLIKILGDGTFGHIFEAWDSRLERSVALKIFKRQTRQSRQDVLREARAAAPLKHPNICTIYSVDEIDGLLVIAMELLDGQSLTEYLTRESTLKDRLQIAVRVSAGLAAAHEKQIMHGDLKPDNILIGNDSFPRILDFGLAHKKISLASAANPQREAKPMSVATDIANGQLDKTMHMAPDVANDNESDGGISGTPAYMAPERWSNHAISAANDIYAFGLIFFELITRHRALQETDLVRLLEQIQDPDLPTRLASQLPTDLGTLCEMMLTLDPNQRPSAKEIRERLLVIESATT